MSELEQRSTQEDEEFDGSFHDSDNESLFEFSTGALDKQVDADMLSAIEEQSKIYPWMPLGQREMRLIALHPAEARASPVCFDLEVYSIDSKPTYHTLSYAWGPIHHDHAHLTETVFANNLPMRVTAHLLAGLQWIRSLSSNWERAWSGQKLNLWIDALCINQKDLEERNRQVRMMGDIYKGGTSLIVWLGQMLFPDECPELQTFKASILADQTDDIPKAWNTPNPAMSNMNWFLRRWVCQEFMLSTRRTFLIAGRLVPVHTLPSKIVDKYSAIMRNRRSSSLIQNLMMCRQSGMRCSHPLDTIFSLLSVCIDGEVITVDYQTDLSHVCYRIALGHVRRKTLGAADMAVLLMHAMVSRPDKKGLPSWVPYWTCEDQTPGTDFSHVRREHNEFSRSLKWLVDQSRDNLRSENIDVPSLVQAAFGIRTPSLAIATGANALLEQLARSPFSYKHIEGDVLEISGILQTPHHTCRPWQNCAEALPKDAKVFHIWNVDIAFILLPVFAAQYHRKEKSKHNTFTLYGWRPCPITKILVDVLLHKRFISFGADMIVDEQYNEHLQQSDSLVTSQVVKHSHRCCSIIDGFREELDARMSKGSRWIQFDTVYLK